MLSKIKHFLYSIFVNNDDLQVGKKVFWENPVDSRFREEFTVFKSKDKRGLVGVHNDSKGKRYAHSSELRPID